MYVNSVKGQPERLGIADAGTHQFFLVGESCKDPGVPYHSLISVLAI